MTLLCVLFVYNVLGPGMDDNDEDGDDDLAELDEEEDVDEEEGDAGDDNDTKGQEAGGDNDLEDAIAKLHV